MGESTYEDAVAAIATVPQTKFDLPAYTGGPADLVYLRDYVMAAVEDIYGVSSAAFETANIFSTTILRDFLNHALQLSTPSFQTLLSQGKTLYPEYQDVASLLRYPAADQCGAHAWQAMQVFRSFGYDAAYVGGQDGAVGTIFGHIATTVYLEDVDQWVIQDAYCNYTLRDTNGKLLSLTEARLLQAADPSSVVIDGLDQYLDTRIGGAIAPINPTDQAIVRNGLLHVQSTSIAYPTDNPGNPPLQHIFDSFVNWQTAHSSAQGGTYATAAAAYDAVMAAAATAGYGWEQTAAKIRASAHYASGFEMAAGAGTWIASQWITVQLANFFFVSINLATGQMLNGSFDQIASEAAGRGPDLNGPLDLSSFLYSPAFLSRGGVLEVDYITKVASTADITVTQDAANSQPWATRTNYYDTADALQAQVFRYDVGGWLRVIYDVASTQAWTNAQSRYDATGRLVAQRFDYDAGGYLSLAWGGDGPDSLSGAHDAGVDELYGNGGDDALNGGGGNDRLIGGAGKDTLDGGPGLDTADFSDKAASVVAFLTGSIAAVVRVGGAAEDTLRNVENVIGGSAADTIVGDGFANVLTGNGGADFLFSNGFNPDGTMKAGAGNDTLNGGDGNDGLFGGDGADTLNGDAGDDGIVGGAGDDTLNGGAGGDFLFGGVFTTGGNFATNSGADTLNGGDGNDGLWGFDGADIINGDAGDDYIEAGAGDDTANGGAGNDFIFGQEGDDTLNGGVGFDYLYGGAGADTFVFRKGDSADWILDFSATEGDRLRLLDFGYANFAAIPLVDLSTAGNPAVQLTFSGPGGFDQLTVFGVTLAQLNAGNVLIA